MTPDPGLPAAARSGTLGAHTAGQLRRLGRVAGLDPADAEAYADLLAATLGPVAARPLDLPPPNRTFLSDDHTPVEYSLSFTRGAPPALRVLFEPGCGADSLARNGRAGLAAIRYMARRWGFSTAALDEVRDLFLPPSPHGPLALWCALELRPGGVPKVKVYLNPAASGPKRSAETVREALRRFGHRRGFDALPPADGHPFLALDLGDWETPRVKVYLRHEDLSASGAAGLPRTAGGPARAEIEEFFRTAAGAPPDGGDGTGGGAEGGDLRLGRRPGLSCHAFTESGSERPSGFTLHIPVRDYARDDAEALDRAADVLRTRGIDAGPLAEALSAATERPLTEGVGLIAYLALAHQEGHPPRVTAYVSAEAYAVRPPAARVRQPEPVI
ncbi:tryptophan dimethylallyltransferase family protein [Streptomyces sp. MS06]|uniref:tryptophan dimethylallyltransferase family protein n=1 Tax=Streptomyces sp. MS06 TaxID=3385974 RepID=UPI0039A3B713